jgi:hypothetical protein
MKNVFSYVFGIEFIAAFIAVAVVFAALYFVDSQAKVNSNDFTANCLDGIEYWYGQSGYKGYMAPRIDSATLDFVRCDG